MSHQIDLTFSICRPQVDREHVKRGIDVTASPSQLPFSPGGPPIIPSLVIVDHSLLFSRRGERGGGRAKREKKERRKKKKKNQHSLDINLLLGGCISHDESDARWRSDGSSVLRVIGRSLCQPLGFVIPRRQLGVARLPCLQSHTFAPAPAVASRPSCHGGESSSAIYDQMRGGDTTHEYIFPLSMQLVDKSTAKSGSFVLTDGSRGAVGVGG